MANFYETELLFRVVSSLDTSAPISPNAGNAVNIWFGLDASGNIYLNGVAADNGANVASVFGRSGTVVATTGDYTVAQITGAAPLASPTFTGHPVGVTETPGNNSTRLASTAYADASSAAAAATAEALALPLAKVRTYRSPSFTSLGSATNSGAQTINWAVPFADNNYTVEATVEINEASSYGAVTSIICVASVQKQAAGAGVIVDIANADSIPHTWKLNLVGIHD